MYWKFNRNKLFYFARLSVAWKGNAIMLTKRTKIRFYSTICVENKKCLLPCSGAVWCDRYILAASFSSLLLATHFSFHLIPFLFVFSCPPTLSLSSSSSWWYLRERLLLFIRLLLLFHINCERTKMTSG